MTTKDAPKIEFPCPNYPVKVVGKGTDNYNEVVIEIVRVHAPGFDVERIKVQDSKNGKFRSLTFYITATSADQLTSLHQALTESELVHMVM